MWESASKRNVITGTTSSSQVPTYVDVETAGLVQVWAKWLLPASQPQGKVEGGPCCLYLSNPGVLRGVLKEDLDRDRKLPQHSPTLPNFNLPKSLQTVKSCHSSPNVSSCLDPPSFDLIKFLFHFRKKTKKQTKKRLFCIVFPSRLLIKGVA